MIEGDETKLQDNLATLLRRSSYRPPGPASQSSIDRMDTRLPDDSHRGPPDVVGLPEAWTAVVDALRHTFQPIVHLRSGRPHGFEARLLGFDDTRFADIAALIDAAHGEGRLPVVQTALHAKAVDAFRRIGGGDGRLFLNTDARAFEHPAMPRLRPPAGLSVNLEVVHRASSSGDVREDAIEQAAARCRAAGIGLCLDHFGSGSTGPRVLYDARPDYIKIHRFFVSGIDQDTRKRTITHALVTSAHALGILIIADGVATANEFYVCRDLGCDFAQGPLIGAPQPAADALPTRIDVVADLNRNDRRKRDENHRLAEVIERLAALPVDAPKARLLEHFRGDDSPPIVPIVDPHGRPLGLIRERDLRRFVYSRFGGELLRNRGLGDRLQHLVVATPVCDLSTPLDQVISAFSSDEASDGINIVEGGAYVGFLSPAALLRLVNERNLAIAADQNPLTRLPGNAAIVRRIEDALADPERAHLLVYLDFDHFKPFNDQFGFRQGDRAILMFGERLRAWAAGGAGFAGHVGGDDFFLAAGGDDGVDEALARVGELIAQFRSDAESLYDPESRERGGFMAKDRYGNLRHHPLLSVSGVAVVVGRGPHGLTPEAINAVIATRKTEAKASPSKLCLVRLPE